MDQQAVQTLPENPHIVVTHAGVIKAALRHILDIDPIRAIGIEVANLGVLRANMMEPDRATDAGGAWQFVSLG
jgi:broad specificity phosphatase PhoE